MAPDLDGRPGEPARSTLPRWVQVCPACNAAARDLSFLAPGAAATSDDGTSTTVDPTATTTAATATTTATTAVPATTLAGG